MREGWIWVMLGRRKRIALAEDGEVEDFSGSWVGLGMIGGRLMWIDHDGSGSGSGEGGRTAAGLAISGRRCRGGGRTSSNERS